MLRLGILPITDGTLPNPRSRRDVAVILGFIVLLVVLFVVLWAFGPLPRVFPPMCSSGCPAPRV